MLTLLMATAPMPRTDAAIVETQWEQEREVEGVTVESRAGMKGFREHRASTVLCSDVATLQSFIADTSRLAEWVPDTEEVRQLKSDDDAEIYYLRSRAPAFFRDRDMIYRLDTDAEPERGQAKVTVTGLPNRLPPVPGVSRMRAAQGAWNLNDLGDRVALTFRMTIDPGAVPRVLANRHMAWTVGKTLANLQARFPCSRAMTQDQSDTVVTGETGSGRR